jgi:hypothetical protein
VTIDANTTKQFHFGEQIIWVNVVWDVIKYAVVLIATSFLTGLFFCIALDWKIFSKLVQNSGKISRKAYLLHIQFTVLLFLQVREIVILDC